VSPLTQVAGAFLTHYKQRANQLIDYNCQVLIKISPVKIQALLLLVLAPLLICSPEAQARSLSVLTYNTALLRFRYLGLEKDFDELIDERAARIPVEVAATGAEVVLLQEVWTRESRKALIEGFLAQGYPYFAWSDADPFILAPLKGEFGNGLLIASRYPVVQREFAHFTANTRAKEYPLAKGVLRARIRVEDRLVDVFDTHLGAMGLDPNDPTVYAKRSVKGHLRQMKILEAFLRKSRKVPRLIGGDFNQHFHEWDAGSHAYKPSLSSFYRVMTRSLRMVDAYVATHGGAPLLEGFLPTFHETDPSRRRETLDYLFADRDLVPVESDLLFHQELEIAGRPAMLSDHYAVRAVFDMK
jgi:endonuclease/exonuclease/phosphatase family metal-dependent hydrolase